MNFWKKPSGVDESISMNNSKIIIYKSELDYLSKCILEYPNIETGGNLFGFWTPLGVPIVHYVVGPGPRAVHNVTHFRQDFEFLERNADFLVAEHALHHIGSWHSHHSLGLTTPSGGDSASTLEGMAECRLKSFLLVIGNCRGGLSAVRPYRYHINGQCELLRWVVLDGVSPVRKPYDAAHPDNVYHPRGTANMDGLDTCSLIDSPARETKVTYPDNYWLYDAGNKKELAAIVAFLKAKFDNVRIYQLDDRTIELQITQGINILKINFDANFPRTAPVLRRAKGTSIEKEENAAWTESGSIHESFINFFNSIVL